MADQASGSGTTAPPPIINNVNLTPQHIQQIINGAVAAAIQQMPQETQEQAVIARTRETSKDLKLAEQKPFSGRSEDLEDFINDCELMFSVKSDVFDEQNPRKIAYALQLMKTGNAALWKKQYIQDNFTENRTLVDSWSDFKRKLRDAFKDIGRAEDAMKWLATAKQGSKSIEEFNTLF